MGREMGSMVGHQQIGMAAPALLGDGADHCSVALAERMVAAED